MIVLDTDVLTHVQRGSGPEYDRLVRLLTSLGEGDAAITIVSLEEQTRGWLAHVAHARTPEALVVAYRRLHTLFADYARWTVLDLTPDAAGRFVELRRTYRRHGAADLKIAAIVMAHDGVFVSGNSRDFAAIAGLRFVPF